MTDHMIKGNDIMLPKFLYDALPYVYMITGLVVAISIENTLAFMSGALFGVTAVYIFSLRGTFAKDWV